MKYKSLSEFDNQNQTFDNIFKLPDEIVDPPTQIFNLQEIIITYENINKYYLNHEDLKALMLIDSLNVFEVANNPYTFSFFSDNNIASILLEYASSKFEFKINCVSIVKIIDFTSSNDDRYKEKFINLSIIDRIKHYLNQYNFLTPFAIVEISYICRYKQSLDYFNYIQFDINKFFNFLMQSCGVNYLAFMKSFELFAPIYDPITNINEISQIINGIDNLIQKFPIDKVQLYGELLNYICSLTKYDFFDDLVNQNQMVQHFINLLYSFNNMTDTPHKEDFLKYLLSLICYFTQDPECPEIQSSFLFNFFDNFKDPKITSFILCIIGNICKYKSTSNQQLVCTSLIQSAMQNGFLKKLVSLIGDANYYRKMEALMCFSRIFSFSPKSVQDEIIKNSGIKLLEFTQTLVDSLSCSNDHSCFDRLLTILNILEFAHQELDQDKYNIFVIEADVNDVLQIELNDDNKEEEIEITGRIKNFLDETSNNNND